MQVNLDLELLRTLVAVVERGTFTAAGLQVGKTQSAVTQQMKRLEEDTGQTLFERQGRQKQLTEHGHTLLLYARKLLSLNDEVMGALQQHSLAVGTLRIGAPHGIADNILPRLLRHISAFLPGIQMEIHVGRSPFLMEDLTRGNIDLAISTRGSDTLEGMLLHSSPTVWLCSADYIFNPHQPLPLILADEISLFRRIAIQALEQQHIPWRLSFLAPTVIGIKAAVRAGLGITARNVELLGPDLRILGEKENLPRLPDVAYYLWSRPATLNPLVKQVIDILNNNRILLSGAAKNRP
ncbi:LysR substrate-binding domain-containing protein [Brenneria tiliae]|uniref:LysR substrate-binding domain-containing protein n=1 Tax=Brenneria tiliae TaxID=2914984 RepID=A0ABT0MV30_9GAMM|nr:LysR substrate-binding domain-containing protein [Brenneria tiliae]MCL2893724.1 LysR substrate-binding domain-containing protein [Brenneria tiliae]